jgi:hypothetical protein
MAGRIRQGQSAQPGPEMMFVRSSSGSSGIGQGAQDFTTFAVRR